MLHTVHLWLVPAPENAALWLQQLDTALPPHQQRRLSAFRNPHDQAIRAAGLALLCTALHELGGIAPAVCLEALHYNAAGQPQLHFGMDTHWQLSFSYSADWTACALRCTPATCTGGLGVDVERSPLSGFAQHFSRVFNPLELQAIIAAKDSADDMTRRWTVKEATLKAQGRGFDSDPHALSTLEQPRTVIPLESTDMAFASLQASIHAIRIAENPVDEIFWQALPLKPHSWLTLASTKMWEKTRIRVLRLV